MGIFQQIAPNDPNFNYQVSNVLNRLSDQVVTKGELVTIGIIDTKAPGGKGAIIRPREPGGVIGVPFPVTGLTIAGAFAFILLSWDAITQKGYSYAEVWRNTTDDLASAVRLGTSIAPLYSDTPSNSDASNTFYYWVRAVNANDIRGPYNQVAGTAGETANDPAYMMSAISSRPWSNEQAYSAFAYVSPSVANGFKYKVQSGGISGANEPAWPASTDATVNDGTVIWIAVPVAKSVPFAIDPITGNVAIDTAFIKDATITNAHIKFVNGDTINAAISLTAPIISGGTVKLGNATGIAAGTGVYIDGNAGSGAFRAGDPLADHIKWDGAALSITGKIIATASSSMPYAAVTGGPPSNADSTQTVIDGGVVTTGFINLSTGGNLRAGQSSFNVGGGFFLGYSGATPVISIGNPSTQSLTWNGSTLAIDGDLVRKVTAGTIPLISATGAVFATYTLLKVAEFKLTSVTGVVTIAVGISAQYLNTYAVYKNGVLVQSWYVSGGATLLVNVAVAVGDVFSLYGNHTWGYPAGSWMFFEVRTNRYLDDVRLL